MKNILAILFLLCATVQAQYTPPNVAVGTGRITNTGTTTITGTGNLIQIGSGTSSLVLVGSGTLVPGVDVLNLKGPIDASGNPNYPAGTKNDYYIVTVAGKVGGGSGVTVGISDLVICETTNGGGDQAAVGADWFVVDLSQTALLPANNLSDVSSVPDSRTNLGLGTGDTVDITQLNIGGNASISNSQINFPGGTTKLADSSGLYDINGNLLKSVPFTISANALLALCSTGGGSIGFDGTGGIVILNQAGQTVLNLDDNGNILFTSIGGSDFTMGFDVYGAAMFYDGLKVIGSDGNGNPAMFYQGTIRFSLDSSGRPEIDTSAGTVFSIDGNAQPRMQSASPVSGSMFGFDVDGNIVLNFGGGMTFKVPSLPNSDPSIPDGVWGNSGVLMLSGSVAPWLTPSGNGSSLTGITAAQVGGVAYSGSGTVVVTGGTLSLTVTTLSGTNGVTGAVAGSGAVAIGVPSTFPVGAVATPTITASGTVRVVVTSGIALSATNTLVIPTGTYQIRILP